MPTLTTIIQHISGSSSQNNQRRKIKKRPQTNKEVKLSLFANVMILYIENPKDTPEENY